MRTERTGDRTAGTTTSTRRWIPALWIPVLWMVVLSVSVLRAESPAGLTLSGYVNNEMPSWLRFSGEYRVRGEGFFGRGFKAPDDSPYMLGRLRINASIQPSGWVRFVFQAQDSRVYGNRTPAFRNPLDLRTGYLELGNPETRAVSLQVGRQEFNYGEQRLLGALNWSNTARTFDAVRVVLRHGPLRLDAFAASLVAIDGERFDRPAAGNNLHGLYGHIERVVPKAVIEPYVLWRLAPRLTGERGMVGNLDFKTTGVRWAGKLPVSFDYSLEVAAQNGALGSERVRAWAGHWLLGRTLEARRWKPRLFGEYNYASGDGDPRDGVRGSFDPLYPTAHDRWGLTDQIGWKNIHHLSAGWESKPRPGWMLGASYHSWWLASRRDGIYAATGALLARVPTGAGNRHVGQEVDLRAVYNVARQIQAGAGLGHVFSGAFLNAAFGRSFTFPYVMLGYSF